MATIRLISTDFDGTLIGFDSDGRCTSHFAEVLAEHRRLGGLWALNTGRGVAHSLEGLERFGGPFLPDFLLTHERHIHRRHASGDWQEHGDWNRRSRERHGRLFDESSAAFAIIREIAEKVPEVTMLYEKEGSVGLVAGSEEIMEDVVVLVDQAAVSVPDFAYQRNSIYMRFCHRDYHKGASLGELCRLEGISASEVFAAGDHYNDLSMLDGTYAAMPACPHNAVPPVKDAVRSAGGYVAARNWADGVAEAMLYYRAHEWQNA